MRQTWSFLTNHARAMVCIAHDPGMRLRDIAAAIGITERRAFGIITDLAQAGYVVKEKEGRRNRYRIQDHFPLGEGVAQDRTIGEMLRLLVDTTAAESAQPQGQDATSARRTPTRARRAPESDLRGR